MIASPDSQSQRQSAFRDYAGRCLQSEVPDPEPAEVERWESRRVTVRVRRVVQRLWPRMDILMLRSRPQVRTHHYDTNRNGIADLYLTTVSVVRGETVEAVILAKSRLRDDSIAPETDVDDLATPDVIEAAKLAHLRGL